MSLQPGTKILLERGLANAKRLKPIWYIPIKGISIPHKAAKGQQPPPASSIMHNSDGGTSDLSNPKRSKT